MTFFALLVSLAIQWRLLKMVFRHGIVTGSNKTFLHMSQPGNLLALKVFSISIFENKNYKTILENIEKCKLKTKEYLLKQRKHFWLFFI